MDGRKRYVVVVRMLAGGGAHASVFAQRGSFRAEKPSYEATRAENAERAIRAALNGLAAETGCEVEEREGQFALVGGRSSAQREFPVSVVVPS